MVWKIYLRIREDRFKNIEEVPRTDCLVLNEGAGKTTLFFRGEEGRLPYILQGGRFPQHPWMFSEDEVVEVTLLTSLPTQSIQPGYYQLESARAVVRDDCTGVRWVDLTAPSVELAKMFFERIQFNASRLKVVSR